MGIFLPDGIFLHLSGPIAVLRIKNAISEYTLTIIKRFFYIIYNKRNIKPKLRWSVFGLNFLKVEIIKVISPKLVYPKMYI